MSKVFHGDHKRTQQEVSDIYSYPIYTTSTSSTLNYMCCPWVHHIVTIRWICCNYTLDIIILISFTMFQTYDITLCDASCDHGHIPLYCPRKRK